MKKEEVERQKISGTKVPSEVENQTLSLGAPHEEFLYLNFTTANFNFQLLVNAINKSVIPWNQSCYETKVIGK